MWDLLREKACPGSAEDICRAHYGKLQGRLEEGIFCLKFFLGYVTRKVHLGIGTSRGRHYSHPCSVLPLAYILYASP